MIVKGRYPLDRQVSNILVIQLGDIGDVVSATPTFRAIKQKYLDARISVLVREGSGDLLKQDPHLSRIFEVRRYRGAPAGRVLDQLRFLRTLREERFDLVIDLRADDRGAYTSLLTGAPIRLAMIYDDMGWRNLFYTHLVRPPVPTERIYGAAEQSLRIVRAFGIDTEDRAPRIRVSEEALRKARTLLESLGPGGHDRYVTINPFSRWRYKEWSLDKWVEIINWLRAKENLCPVLVGSPEESERADQICSRSDAGTLDLSGKTTLGELAAVLGLSSLHIGVDSAPPHIAAAVGTPTITIYGPTDWRDWLPPGEKHRVITPAKECVPCRKKGCEGGGVSLCLEELGVDEVRGQIKAFIETLTNV